MSRIEVIAEHSVDMSLIKPGSMILDIGCRGFEFTDHFRKLGHCVFAVDIDNLDRKDYIQCAVGGMDGRVGIEKSSDPQATRMREGNEVNCLTLQRMVAFTGCQLMALIKMDVEGAEYPAIMALTEAPAKQLSIEFHLHTKVYNEFAVDGMVGKLKGLGYKVAQHKKTEAHGCGMNYWDSLFILK